MRFLLDTHAFLWALRDDARLSQAIRARLDAPASEGWVSVVSLWEIAIKVRVGKLQADIEKTTAAVASSGLRLLDLQVRHVAAVGRLPKVARHHDPFDHLLMAQAIVEDLIFVSDDAHVARYPVTVARCS